MISKTIAPGVWPTMITPYHPDGRIDRTALAGLVEWYLARGVAGLFAVCQSSEMFFLSLRERLDLARECVRLAAGRVPVIASGHVAESLDDQIEEAKMMADTGVDAVVLLTNRFARRNEADDVFRSALERFLSGMYADTLLGFYECPAPYKRIMSPALVRFAAGTGRFGFLKDTSCSMRSIEDKIHAAGDGGFRIFNANAATLLASLRVGCAGYAGIMANFHPGLYAWLCDRWKEEPGAAQRLQDFLGLASVIEYQLYPVNAMYALTLEGLDIGIVSRRADPALFTESMRLEVAQLMGVSRRYSAEYPVRGAPAVREAAPPEGDLPGNGGG